MAAPTKKAKQPDAKHTMDDDESWTSVSSQNDADQEDRPERDMPEELVRAPAEEAWLFQTDDLVDVRRTFARVCDARARSAAADRSPPAADTRAAAAAGERELPAASYDTHRRGKRADGHSLRRRYADNLEPVEEIETARRPAVGDAYPYSSGPLTVATTPLDALLPELLGTKWSRGHGTAALAKGRRWDDARELLDALVRDGRASADRGVVVRERGVYGLQAHVATRYKVGKGWLDLGDFRGPETCFEEAAAALGNAPGASADGPWLGVRCRALRFRAGGAPLKVAAYGRWAISHRERRYSREWAFGDKFGYRRRRRARRDLADQLRDLT
ncbi:hypothetical protein JL720_3718 [Aureococcus anophagefferens]|nr:hypothetical protein JL720_3718 [Aureococcus anophagefferens]